MNAPVWNEFARTALEEDRAFHDVTTGLLGRHGAKPGEGRFLAEGEFVVAGLPLVQAVFAELGGVEVSAAPNTEGGWAGPGDIFAIASGPTAHLLAGERVALNYLQRLSGVATQTRRAVDSVAGLNVAIVDTRKTTPGLRALEKYAVKVGGGVNHRFSLEDAVLWKDNHWALLDAAGETLANVLGLAPSGIPVQVEVEREDQLRAVREAGVTFVLIDNQSPATIKRWSEVLGPDVVIEASGGITADRVRDYAEAGVQRISMGALTHSVHAASISFEVSF